MAIKGNKSSDEVVKQYKKYEGISIMKVVAVNPNKEELATFGINVENDPVYVGKDKENIDMAYIDFYVQYKISDTEKPITRIDRFFIKDKKVKSTKNDGMQWVDKYGNQLWQANKPTATDIANKKLELKWFQFDADSARNAYEGEVELYDFISIWLNLKREDEISLDKISDLFNNNFKELKEIFKAWKDNLFWGYLHVRNEKYQSVYNKLFFREKTTQGNIHSGLLKHFAKKNMIKVNLDIHEYIPSVQADADPDSSSESGNELPF